MPVPAQNQQYENFIIRYKQNTQGGFDYESDETFQIVNDLFGKKKRRRKTASFFYETMKKIVIKSKK